MQALCTKCNKAYREYELEIVNRGYTLAYCNNNKCRGNVVEIDDLILPAIIELNKKGYHTNFCCSGHLWGDSNRISFYVFFKEDCVPLDAPENFKYDDRGIHAGETIRYRTDKFNSSNRLKRYKQLFDINLEFYEWTLSLPKNEKALDLALQV